MSSGPPNPKPISRPLSHLAFTNSVTLNKAQPVSGDLQSSLMWTVVCQKLRINNSHMLVGDTHTGPSVQMAPSPEWRFCIFLSSPASWPQPAWPAALPKVAVVKEFAKVALSGLVHAPLNSTPEPEGAWVPPPTHVTLPSTAW